MAEGKNMGGFDAQERRPQPGTTDAAKPLALRAPTLAEKLAYVDCLRFQRKRLGERGAGRSGYLSDADEKLHTTAYATVERALDTGAQFSIELMTEELGRAA